MSRKCKGFKTNGEPCDKWAMKGGLVCDTHGGRAPQVKAKAAVRAEVMSWGLDDTKEDPSEVFLRLLSQSARRASRYSVELEKLVEEVGLETALKTELAKKELEERTFAGNLATKGIAAGLKEREVRIMERQVEILGGAVTAVLKAMNPTPEQRALAEKALAEHLGLMAADG